MNLLQYEYIIIGSGLAGLYTAAYASKFGKVALLTKSTIEISNTYWAQGGIAAVVTEEDNVDLHVSDTLEAGRGLCDKNAVEVLVEDGHVRIIDLIEMGMTFDTENGKLALGLEGGHSKRRILHAGGDATGKKVVEFLKCYIKENKNIDIFENTFVYDLIKKDSVCVGVKAFNGIDKINYTILAKGTVIATGGASGIFSKTTNPRTSTGDGLFLAYNAGANLADMEFIQFHPTVYHAKNNKSFLISEAVRGEGAYLVTEDLNRFMPEIDKLAELAPRDVVAKAIFNKTKEGKKVFLTLKHLNAEKIKKRFSTIYAELKNYGLDLTSDLINIEPAAHYFVGGIKTDVNGATNVKGLYAIGESASTGVHGANRLASNSLLECLVFGKRAIDNINCQNFNISNITFFTTDDIYADDDSFLEYEKLKEDIADLMTNNCGILRTEEELEDSLIKINNYNNNIKYIKDEFNSFRKEMIITVAKLIIKSAIERKESRGGHNRKDFPSENKDFTKHVLQNKEKGMFYTEVI
ncbi:MAG TPA: L-aspartate oxidase [Melioribacteraceae bacterium]|nr:L-aspartate oxidase [Melioribacteraceae bacterium]